MSPSMRLRWIPPLSLGTTLSRNSVCRGLAPATFCPSTPPRPEAMCSQNFRDRQLKAPTLNLRDRHAISTPLGTTRELLPAVLIAPLMFAFCVEASRYTQRTVTILYRLPRSRGGLGLG